MTRHIIPHHLILRSCVALKAPVAAAQPLFTILDLDLEFDPDFDLDLDLDLDLDIRHSTPQSSRVVLL